MTLDSIMILLTILLAQNREQFSVPEIYKYDMEANPKPWNDNGKQDLDKYFNYGFNEDTWKYHSREMIERANLSAQLA